MPITAINRNYQKTVEQGYSTMKNLRIALCSIVRDCDSQLSKNIRRIEKLRKLFKQFYAIIVENDSIDDTKKVLEEWGKNNDNIYLFINDFRTTNKPKTVDINPNYSIHRIERMAFYRNLYLQKLEELELDVDYVIIMDLDIHDFYINGIAHSFGVTDEWDVVTANGKNISPKFIDKIRCKYIYFDTYALQELRNSSPQTEHDIFSKIYKYSKIPTGQPLIKVNSAFNGLAIYKASAIKNVRYSCRINDDQRVEAKCEHVALHEDIRNKGNDKIYINPSMILYYDRYLHYFIIKVFKYIKKIIP